MSTNPSSTQKFSRNKQAGGGAYNLSPPRLELSDPRFMQNLCWKESARPFVSAKTKKICQLKCCNLFINKCCLQTALMFIFCVFQYGRYTKSFLSPFGCSQSPSANLVLFGLVWSNHIAGKMYPEMDIRRTVE